MAWEKREVEPVESVPREQRGEVWARWLAEGRYRSGAELARACGVSRETVSAAVRREIGLPERLTTGCLAGPRRSAKDRHEALQ
jgi:hypothetical protein